MEKRAVDKKLAATELDSIIDKAGLPAAETSLLKKVMHGLKNHEVDVLQSLKERAEQELRRLGSERRPTGGRLVVQLIPAGEEKRWQEKGFFAMAELDNICFLNCAYEDLDRLVLEGGTSYQFRRVPDFINLERKLLRVMKDSGGTDRPLIFDPWSRRAVRLVLKNGSKESPPPMPGPGQDIISGCKLVWNIEPKKKTLEQSFAADGSLNRYQYFCDDEGSKVAFLELDDQDTEAGISRQENGFSILPQARLSSKEVTLYRLREIDEESLAECSDTAFFNSWQEKIACGRLRTRGDIEKMLSSFFYKERGFSCSFADIDGDDGDIIQRYEEKDSCKYSDSDELFYRKGSQRPLCRVRFSGPEKWLTDYAEYVLAYLEYMYPEFRWAGVR